MGIFNNKNNGAPEFYTPVEPGLSEDQVGYNEVIEYLVGLSEKDYDTVCKVAAIYRKSNQDVSKTLGIKPEPTSFIMAPEEPEDEPQGLELEDDLDFIEAKPATKKGKKIKVVRK